ncbi:MAG TPA: hypothetical protein PKY30_23820 [Myxococcota bacterium]|nr:hypothetical protein [Myxococcota bacterium]HNH50087.1 hypothetical protein [Myxococcota bacterium]
MSIHSPHNLYIPPELDLRAELLCGFFGLGECYKLYRATTGTFFGRLERPPYLFPGQLPWGLYDHKGGELVRGRTPSQCWSLL